MHTLVPRKLFLVHGRVTPPPPPSKVKWSTLRTQDMLGKKFGNILKFLAKEIVNNRIYVIVWSKISFIYI